MSCYGTCTPGDTTRLQQRETQQALSKSSYWRQRTNFQHPTFQHLRFGQLSFNISDNSYQESSPASLPAWGFMVHASTRYWMGHCAPLAFLNQWQISEGEHNLCTIVVNAIHWMAYFSFLSAVPSFQHCCQKPAEELFPTLEGCQASGWWDPQRQTDHQLFPGEEEGGSPRPPPLCR